ncbi:MAG: hypothetical protein M3378_11210, partial [Actinomycetota bacterium]|nr:hypothetical protein [Actinomycetota bacterium]
MTVATVVALMVLATLAAGRAAMIVPRTAGPTAVPSSRLTAWHPGHRPLPPAPRWLAPRLAETGLDLATDRGWWGWLGASGAIAAAALLAGGPGLALLAIGVATGAPAVAWTLLRHRGEAGLEASLPGAVDEIARGLRSGASLRQAIAEAARATSG